jgi:hypothetical protein
MGCGDRQPGTKSRQSCLSFCPMTLAKPDGGQLLSRMRMPSSASSALVSHPLFLLTNYLTGILLSEYAAAFFLLGGSLKDAVSVCIKQLSDFQLAIAIARVVEQSNEGPVLMSILNNSVIPTAFSSGNRWLASWAFWLLHRRDLAVRILVVCPRWLI